MSFLELELITPFLYKHSVYKHTDGQTTKKSKHILSIYPASKTLDQNIIYYILMCRDCILMHLKVHESLKNLEKCQSNFFLSAFVSLIKVVWCVSSRQISHCLLKVNVTMSSD